MQFTEKDRVQQHQRKSASKEATNTTLSNETWALKRRLHIPFDNKMKSLLIGREDLLTSDRQDEILCLNPLCGEIVIFPAERSHNLPQNINQTCVCDHVTDGWVGLARQH